MRVLITGFPPFPGRPVNPTQSLIEALPGVGTLVPGITLIPVLLPVEYAGIERAYRSALERHRPDLVLSFGVGRQSSPIRLERQGINEDNATIPDNAGELRQGLPIDPEGPAAIENDLDLNALSRLLREQGIETEISSDSGRYLCNHLNYLGLTYAAHSPHPHQFLFTHVASEDLFPSPDFLVKTLQTMLEWFLIQNTTRSDTHPTDSETSRT